MIYVILEDLREEMVDRGESLLPGTVGYYVKTAISLRVIVIAK